MFQISVSIDFLKVNRSSVTLKERILLAILGVIDNKYKGQLLGTSVHRKAKQLKQPEKLVQSSLQQEENGNWKN